MQRLIKILNQFGIKSIYHFTDRSNLQSIQKYGIQSLRNISSQNIPVSRYGAESLSHLLDRQSGLDRYVHLSFIKDHPMYHVAKKRGNIIDPIWLELDISILFDSTTKFCDVVANARYANIFGIEKVLKYISFKDMVYPKDFETKKEVRKAEIMAYGQVPKYKIIGVSSGY